MSPDVSVENVIFVELGGQRMVATILRPAPNNAPVDGSPLSNHTELSSQTQLIWQDNVFQVGLRGRPTQSLHKSQRNKSQLLPRYSLLLKFC